MATPNRSSNPWFIVVADDHGHAWAPMIRNGELPVPVQYARFGGSSTLLQNALRRATRIAPASQVMVTVLDEYRELWEPSVWFVRPEHRFVCEGYAESNLTAAAAVLKIAAASPSNVVVIAPGRVHVRREDVLEAALYNALAVLPSIREGALTLAMIDAEDGIDEDYLIVERSSSSAGLPVLGVSRRPNTWVANHLRRQGALVASGIMVGYAGVFAAHVSRQWPGLTKWLNQLADTATSASAECELSMHFTRSLPNPTIATLRWHAPTLKQRALGVEGCGWSGLRSARAAARTHDYLSKRTTMSHAMWSGSTVFEKPGALDALAGVNCSQGGPRYHSLDHSRMLGEGILLKQSVGRRHSPGTEP
jgi:mannose-1-phosphate guanylyltransferase